jgi:hypothetical protein
MEIRQPTSEKLMCQRRNKKRNKKGSLDKGKWTQDIPKFMRCNKSTSKRKVYSDKFLY